MQWEPVVTVRLPYPVSTNRYWGRRWVPASKGKPGFIHDYLTPEARTYREEVGWLLRQAGIGHPITGRARIDVQFYPKCPKDWRQRMAKDPLWWADTVQRLDLDNCLKVIGDSLIGIALKDDDQVWKITSEVMEPQPDVDASVVLRICRGLKDQPQEVIPMPEQPREVSFP